jgi:5-formyltetrahydrofolate cyclo-ligase
MTRSEIDVASSKKDLRARMIAARDALSPDVRAAGAEAVARIGLDYTAARPPAVVSAFLSIGAEIDTAPLMDELQRSGHRIALPVMVGKGKPLQFRAWAPGDPLRTVQWGIREPGDDAPVLEPDVLLVPLLAFDRTGARLGYGGGFYDRTLRGLRERRSAVAVGLAFSMQEVDAVPHLDYDERLDWVLTPDGPIRCGL